LRVTVFEDLLYEYVEAVRSDGAGWLVRLVGTVGRYGWSVRLVLGDPVEDMAADLLTLVKGRIAATITLDRALTALCHVEVGCVVVRKMETTRRGKSRRHRSPYARLAVSAYRYVVARSRHRAIHRMTPPRVNFPR
jgi:hypothetical protein